MSQVGKEMSTTTSVKSKAKSSGIYRRRAAGKKTSNALFREISDLNLGDLPSTYTPRETMEAEGIVRVAPARCGSTVASHSAVGTGKQAAKLISTAE